MERIKLTREEKATLINVGCLGMKKPECLSETDFQYSLVTLKEKGMVDMKSDHEKAYSAKLTIKGKAYIERNPTLKNPILWKDIITITLAMITAISTLLALFIGCSIING